MLGSYRTRPAVSVLLFSLLTAFPATAQRPEALSYRVEWLGIHAGNARFSWSPANAGEASGWRATLDLESVGLVSKFYKVNNQYSSTLDDQLCVRSSLLKARERGGERETQVTFDRQRQKAVYLERDLVKKRVADAHEIDVPACVHDVLGALQRLRAMRLETGQSTEIPLSDGKKSILARVEAQERETVRTPTGSYKTIRYEAFLFDNLLYRRKGRLFVWLTDDQRRLPVQIRMRLSLPIGTVTLQLEKEVKT
jgi:hypothetical protein